MTKIMSFIALMLCLLMAAVNGYADTSIINEYDANGNLVTGDGRYYEYNDENQLVRVKQGDQAGPVIAEYLYDSSGQRVKKIENGVVTYYVGKHFEMQVGGANEGSTSYYFGEGGERVAKKDPAGNVFYYHLDHLDGVNAVTDSDGTVVARTDYLPFGDVRAGGSGSEKYSYTGKEKDKTDLYYFEARYNSPEFRHFTQADIAEPDYDDPQDLNRYAYVGNNPLSYVDYDGFKKKKKKAKLSKREKWMIAHGVDPDHDKTPLKKAKKLFKAGKKYTTAAKSTTAKASSAKSNPTAGGGTPVSSGTVLGEKYIEAPDSLSVPDSQSDNGINWGIELAKGFVSPRTGFSNTIFATKALGHVLIKYGASNLGTTILAESTGFGIVIGGVIYMGILEYEAYQKNSYNGILISGGDGRSASEILNDPNTNIEAMCNGAGVNLLGQVNPAFQGQSCAISCISED